MFDAVCDNCGKNCQVPFMPTSGKPIYCSDCFRNIKDDGGDRDRQPRRDYSAPSNSNDNSQKELIAISNKLDRIITLLEKKSQTEIVLQKEVLPSVVEKKPAKTKQAKKSVEETKPKKTTKKASKPKTTTKAKK